MPGVHIDKLSKDISFDISKKPVGAIQWDFMKSMDLKDNLLQKYGKGPEAVFFYLNNICSDLCPICKKKEISSMDKKTALEIIRQLKEIGVKYVILDGEPLLHKDIYEILRYLKDLEIQVSLNIGMYVGPDIIKRLQGLNINKIQVRFDGLKNHYEDSDRFNSLKGILESCKETEEYSSVIFTIDETNHGDAADFIDFCDGLGVGQFSFIRLPSCVFSKPNKDTLLTKNNFKKLSEFLVEKRRENRDGLHITSNEAIWKGCGAAFISCCILSDTKMIPCIYLDVGDHYLDKEEFSEIWGSETFSKLRDSSNLVGKCKDCNYNFYCKGCRGFADACTGNPDAADPGCWIEFE